MPLSSLIDVRPPYYALRLVDAPSTAVLRARFHREHPLGSEVGPLAGAEAGRHLAVLGACACSTVREPAAPHYYLAHRAQLVRHDDPRVEHAHEFEATARVVASSAREARARTELRAIGSELLLFELDVTYKVLSRPVFQRLFAAHRRELRAAPRPVASPAGLAELARRANPYQRALPLEITQRSTAGVRARLAEVKPEMCAGHFPMYPALPVAVLMHSLTTLCGDALRARWDEATKFRIQRADVFADRLAFAGEALEFEAFHRGGVADAEQYEARAISANGTLIGRLVIDLQPVSAGYSRSLAGQRLDEAVSAE